jgi:NTP pyrophosphatase (non-canonical NTP hydrolase)
MSLTFDELRTANTARVDEFKNNKGELVRNKNRGADWTPAQWLQALVGELGEYANWRKKYERGDITEEQFHIEAEKELADVQTYLDILAMRLNIDLGEATRLKFNEVSDRIGCTIKL